MDNIHPIYILILALSLNILSQLYIKLVHKFTFLKSIKFGFSLGLVFFIIFFYNNTKLNIWDKFEISLLYILASYCYIVLINTPESSVRLKILFLIYKKKITKKKLLQKYNNNEMFKLRLKKLLKSKTIGIKKYNLFVINKNIIILFYLFKFLKKIYLGNNTKL
jgi:hypothetical protein